MNATEPHTAVANVEKQPHHTGKAKEGFVFLDKDLHAAKYVIKMIKSLLKKHTQKPDRIRFHTVSSALRQNDKVKAECT